MAALPMTNITTTLARNTIGETTNSVRGLCISPNINQWALHKPADYGAGNNAWTTDAGTRTGYKLPKGISSDATGHRLGDFRGYDHAALPPRYYPGNYTFTYYRYEPKPLTTVVIKKGSYYPTSNANGFNPTFYQTDDGLGGTLLGVRPELNGVDQDVVKEVFDLTGDLSFSFVPTISPNTTVLLDGVYWLRLDTLSGWAKGSNIEGGTVTYTLTRLAARLSVSNAVISPSTGVTGVEYGNVVQDYSYSFSLSNSSSSNVTVTFIWQIHEQGSTVVLHSGQQTFIVAANATESKNFTITSLSLSAGATGTFKYYDFELKELDGPEIVPNSIVTITIESA